MPSKPVRHTCFLLPPHSAPFCPPPMLHTFCHTSPTTPVLPRPPCICPSGSDNACMLVTENALLSPPPPPSSLQVVEMSCASQCSGHGNCLHGFCKCHEGWYGTDCARKRAGLKMEPGMFASCGGQGGVCVLRGLREE